MTARTKRREKDEQGWEAPHTAWLKVNVDGAFDSVASGDGVASGVVIRDEAGSVQLSAWKFIGADQDRVRRKWRL
ncbi:hypothetical protein C2845_PM16G09560 [Panicum miliaceum]|uniref:RNase H type-1 domain-containing protein n=1 Tax=Panicum miliaceum TaxID=4540 RepID=A0A3L6PV53_PANMI|nr:hypothetical protein C2845_PM16G09560 [Panicum miliaceum]